MGLLRQCLQEVRERECPQPPIFTVVVQGRVPQQRLLQVLPTLEAVASQHIGNAPVEAFDHAVGARRSGLGQPVFNPQAGTQLIELVLPRGLPGPRGEEPIGELLAVVGEHLLNAHRTSLVHGIEKPLALAAVLFFLICTNTQRVARSMATNR